jgi:hypothetical protein
MPRFEVYSESSLVGWSELEFGDPPMGIAVGKFIPAPAYEHIQAAVVQASGEGLPDLRLSVRITGGEVIQTVGGVHIADYSADLGAEGQEVSVLGISYPPYDLLFPEHVSSYERQFKNGA